MKTLLITSAAFIDAELSAEFGQLPPAFLPLGTKRLFWHQREIIGAAANRILLSIPESFVIEETDRRSLKDLGIETVPVPEGLSLGESLVYVINVTASAASPLAVLHGDTLLYGIDFAVPNAVSVSDPAPSRYRWGFAQIEGKHVTKIAGDRLGSGESALTGYFCFADTALLVQALTRSTGDFLRGLSDYAEAVNVEALRSTDWLDFGHTGTYHRSRRRVTTEREFNRLIATPRTVVKSGSNQHKLCAEALWYETIPGEVRVFTPAYIGRRTVDVTVSYEIEYLLLPTLAELYVFGCLRRRAWEDIFGACDEFLSTCARIKSAARASADHVSIYRDKTERRLVEFAEATGAELSLPWKLNGRTLPSICEMARIAENIVLAEDGGVDVLIHGDLCFSNVLYDTRANMVRVIDPRGLDGGGRFNMYGDLRYDIGKLYHSAIGLYDHIVAGQCHVKRLGSRELTLELPANDGTRDVAAAFLASRFAGLRPTDAAAPAIAVLLFFSMLPLHADDPERQWALLANAMRLFAELDAMVGD